MKVQLWRARMPLREGLNKHFSEQTGSARAWIKWGRDGQLRVEVDAGRTSHCITHNGRVEGLIGSARFAAIRIGVTLRLHWKELNPV